MVTTRQKPAVTYKEMSDVEDDDDASGDGKGDVTFNIDEMPS